MTRKLPKLLALLLLVTALGAVPLLMLALGGGTVTQPIACLDVEDGHTFGGIRLDAEQLEVAKAAVAAVRAFEPTTETPHASVIVLATGYQESSLRNLDHGDRDSLGFLQQRPSQGWGTPAQVRDVHHAATTFLKALMHVPDWQTRPVTEVATDVQHPDPRYADRYQQWVPLATVLTEQLWPTSLTPTETPTPTTYPEPTLDPGRPSGSVTTAHANLYVGETPPQFRSDLAQVTAQHPDFVTLNEVYNRTPAALQPDGYQAWHPENPRYARDTAVLWRSDAWTLVDQGSRLMHARDVRWGTRYVAWTTLRHQVDRTVLSVIAAHASPAGPGRRGLYEEFRSNLIDLMTWLHTRGPVIVGGDLNVHYPHLLPAVADAFEQPFAAADAHTSYAVLGEPEGGWATGTHHGATIDYVITTNDAPPVAHATSTLSFSDHRMISAKIQLDHTTAPDDWPDDWPGTGKGCDPVVLTGITGDVAYPVPADLAWTNKDNWGSQGDHWASWHTGTDFSVGCGTPVLASHVGIIEIDTAEPWAGPQLLKVTRGPHQLTTWYAHLERVLVAPGQVVQPGDQIGAAGDEGNATGCHLHFEVHLRDGPIYGSDNTDPTSWLASHVHPKILQPLG